MNCNNVEITVLQLKHLQIACVYSRPKESVNALISSMNRLIKRLHQNIPIVIMGDFNCDIRQTNNRGKKLLQFMEACGFQQLIKEFTTDGNTFIDLIFTNPKQDIECGTLESYCSYHKPLWMAIQK